MYSLCLNPCQWLNQLGLSACVDCPITKAGGYHTREIVMTAGKLPKLRRGRKGK